MSHHTIIIAEAGVNHNGDINMARRLIYAAKEAGADYVKFQTAVPELVISAYAPKAEYQKETTGEAQSQLEMCKAIHLPLSAYAELKRICDDVNIGFMSTPFDRPSIECLEAFDMDYWKIPSGEVTNLPYLRRIARPGRRIILSTGMSTLDEVDRAVGILEKGGVQRTDVILLHCTTQYPTPYEAVNLRAMDALATLGCGGVGYSDHTVGIAVPLAAVGHGACVIEKHFTMSRSLPGPDHRASLEYDELRRMVQEIRRIDVALGDGIKIAADAERSNIEVARRSIVAARAIAKGEVLTEENLEVKRPGGGISPMLWDEIIGTPAIRSFAPDELIER